MNFYFEAAKVLDRLDNKQGSIKGVLASIPDKDRKRTSAAVIETLKYKQALTTVIQQSDLLNFERKKLNSMNLTLLIVHDLLLSRGIQAGDGPIKQAVLRHKTRLNGELQKLKIKRGAKSVSDLAQAGDERAAAIPRYVRVNTLRISSEDALEALQTKGFKLVDTLDFSSARTMRKDPHIADLLQFPPTTAFHDDPMYKSGKLILQDKASCFPAVILNPPASAQSQVIDATAAPGNKTSLLSAMMKNQGHLYAFEKDKFRFKTLNKMLSTAGCTNVEAVNADFLTIDPHDKDYSAVTHILLDPSCSGSGIVNRLDYLADPNNEQVEVEADEARLLKLSSFQVMMICHAMKFPSAKRIVYSTCSIHAAENERVICAALKSEEAQDNGFSLAPRAEVLPNWPRRGNVADFDDDLKEYTDRVVRCSPDEDGTNGFFVSCFIRNTKRATQKRGHTENDGEKPLPSKKRKKRQVAPST